MAKQNPLTEGAIRALNALKKAKGPVTLADINAKLDQPIASAHLTSLKRRGLISTDITEVEVTRVQKVNTYTLTSDGKSFDPNSDDLV
jgi:DNA-binding transcriptional ArsR family regulator